MRQGVYAPNVDWTGKMQKYRIHKWLNLKTMKENFGIQVKLGKTWYHVCQNDAVLVFDSEEKADFWITIDDKSNLRYIELHRGKFTEYKKAA